MYLTNWKINL